MKSELTRNLAELPTRVPAQQAYTPFIYLVALRARRRPGNHRTREQRAVRSPQTFGWASGGAYELRYSKS